MARCATYRKKEIKATNFDFKPSVIEKISDLFREYPAIGEEKMG
jgi:histone deacetylase complex regulatory component SIN3